MDPKDIQIRRLTNNLRDLAAFASAHSAIESERSVKAIRDARTSVLTADAQASPPGVQQAQGGRRRKAAVVAWDLGHNPVGRAYAIYRLLEDAWEVELVGPLWTRYGSALWSPLRRTDLRIRSFACRNFEDFLPKAEVLAATGTYDLVYVCKPRLPSLILGAMLQDSSACPMVCDVDDLELSFFRDESYLAFEDFRAQARSALHEPFEEAGTRYAQTLVSAADAVTVSNVALQQRFGGHMVRHARAEDEFINSPERRSSARQELGIADTDFALMFIGTPRPHKGVLEVAKALHALDDDSIVFHIVGDITDKALVAALAEQSSARLVHHGNCAFEDLPRLLAGADLVPLVQDVNHPISQYQIPAKISDALALGVPVLATCTPPLADLIAAGAILGTTTDTLAEDILTIKHRIVGADSRGRSERRHFLGELGHAINRVRMNQAIDEAEARHAATAAGQDDALCGPMRQLLDLCREEYKRLRVERVQRLLDTGYATRAQPEAVPPRPVRGLAGRRAGGLADRLSGLMGTRSRGYDISFFWKQNDSGLYGRRADMVSRYLAASPRVNRMVHFDAPVAARALDQHFTGAIGCVGDQQSRLLQVMLDRELGVYDTADLRNHTYLHSGSRGQGRFVGRPLGNKESYVRYVREQIERAGLCPERTIAWFCPVVWDAKELIDKVGFAGVVVDLIDDQRAWDGNETLARRLNGNYRETLAEADLVVANCQSLADAMREFYPAIQVVPNGAERLAERPAGPLPEALAAIDGPIAGYVGNLRDRIDWYLLQQVVAAMPDVSFVFYGPSSDNPNADSLAGFPNVHMMGVLPYTELASHLRAFDVGLVPHVNNRLTQRMNPLKVYNYFAAGIPVVSSDIHNVENLGDSVQTVTDPVGFQSAVRRAIDTKIDIADPAWQQTMTRIAWDTRVDELLALMDQNLPQRLRRFA